MIDLHSHSFFSDGVLVPSELVRRAEHKGLRAIGITDHGDLSNIDFIIPRITAVAEQLNQVMAIRVIPGIELTHVPPSQIGLAAEKSRRLGAKIIIVHGETIVEPVAKGTNHAALEADVDILAHPGLIDEADVILARDKGILLEITARKGHSLTNGHVAALSVKHGAGLVINTDSHEPGDLIDSDFARKVILGAGLPPEHFEIMQANAARFI
ncbi:histidinol phosphate phosphatase domain-containing protein [Desulfatiferula olefinivorans]